MLKFDVFAALPTPFLCGKLLLHFRLVAPHQPAFSFWLINLSYEFSERRSVKVVA